MPLFGRQFIRSLAAKKRKWRKERKEFGFTPMEPKKIDWRKSDKELASATGYHRNSINKLRKKLGKKLPPTSRVWRKELQRRANWDWRNDNRTLARIHGVWPSSVQRSRMRLRRLGYNTKSIFEEASQKV